MQMLHAQLRAVEANGDDDHWSNLAHEGEAFQPYHGLKKEFAPFGTAQFGRQKIVLPFGNGGLQRFGAPMRQHHHRHQTKKKVVSKDGSYVSVSETSVVSDSTDTSSHTFSHTGNAFDASSILNSEGDDGEPLGLRLEGFPPDALSTFRSDMRDYGEPDAEGVDPTSQEGGH